MSPFIAFLIAALLLAITPGPGIAYVIARTAAGGRKEGLASCLGTGIGGMLHVAAAALGISVLIAQSAYAFSIVKYIGAAYLIFLGIRILLNKGNEASNPKVAAQGPRRAFFEGIAVEALNVKTALFFLAFLPQFISQNQAPIPLLILLGSICVALNTAVDVVAVFAADRFLRGQTARVGRARLMNRTSGITMIFLGAYLAIAKRES